MARSHARPGRRLPVLATLAALLLWLPPASARAQSTNQNPGDERAALAVVQRLFDAMRTRDTAAIRALFEPGARLTGVRPAPDGSIRLQNLTVSQFVAFVGRDKRAEWIERAWNPEVRVSGTLAHVWTEYDFHFGSTFSHCGVDSAQLLKVGGAWRIVSLADTFVQNGCVRRAPPVGGGGGTPRPGGGGR